MPAFVSFLLLLLVSSPALANNGQSSGWTEGLGFLVPLIAMAAIFYFLIIRPQNKRMADHRQMVANLKRGDVVITAGGLVGKIHRIIDDNECMVELAEGMRVRVVRGTISQVREKNA